MTRRLTAFAALCTGALAAVVALPLVSTARHPHGEAVLATDAHADPVNPPPTPDARQLGMLPSLAPLVKQLRPVVVNINSKFKPQKRTTSRRLPPGHPQAPFGGGDGDEEDGDQQQQDPFERFFGGPRGQPREGRGLGSGFLIGDGYVLTNNHVVMVPDENGKGRQRPMDEIKVITDESSPVGVREFAAKVIGADDKADVALLKIEGKEVAQLKAATLGDSDALEVGDYVVAIGEPFGLQASVTSGIVSAKERTQFGGAYSDYLQTDASINPGNSGGPLFNLRGEVVGINSAIIQNANTIGFAIPIAVVKQILPQLKENGRVARGFLGVSPQAITQDMVDQLGLKSTKGALVADVVKDGPAQKAGLKPGDVIVGLNGRPVNDNYQLTRDIGAVQPGHAVKLDVLREGKTRVVEAKLEKRPEEKDSPVRVGQNDRTEQGKGDSLGLQVEDLTPQLARRAGIEDETKGVVVTDVATDSPAGAAQLEPGDVILEANRRPIATAADYRNAVKGARKGDTLLLRVKRGQNSQYVPVKLK